MGNDHVVIEESQIPIAFHTNLITAQSDMTRSKQTIDMDTT